MTQKYSIRVYKEYFNFACAHFLVFANGSREPLHGHNYRVRVCGRSDQLADDMVFDFLKIKPLVREICDSLDHKVILAGSNKLTNMREEGQNLVVTTPDESIFSFPKKDTLILPIANTSAERFAIYIAERLKEAVRNQYNYFFDSLEVEVEETIGQSATVSVAGE